MDSRIERIYDSPALVTCQALFLQRHGRLLRPCHVPRHPRANLLQIVLATQRDLGTCGWRGDVDIYIIRHGQTDANLRHELQGRRDIPLNEKGREQAELMRALFERRSIRFERAYSSPLGRAVETARIVTGGCVPIETDDRLLEMDYGPYEGADLLNPAPEIATFFSDFINNPAPRGMEQLSSVTARAGDFLESIAGSTAGNVLVSTHAIAMKGLLEYLTPASRGSYWAKFIGNCAVYRCSWHDGAFSVPTEVFDAYMIE